MGSSSNGLASQPTEARVEHFRAVAWVVDEAQLNQEARLERHDGEPRVLALALGLCTPRAGPKRFDDGLVDCRGNRLVF
ncbi:MAG: hypothetical protein MUF31_15960 [Akkermansiaceae bacterium]|nr:hypothetical protein [Akkermansiaceae bacterium]